MSLPSTMTNTLSTEELRLIDTLWRAANHLSVGQIYLLTSGSECRPGRRTA